MNMAHVAPEVEGESLTALPGPSQTKPDGPSTAKKAPAPADVDVSDYHVGGGWYELPSGEKVRGKEEAREALTA
jgi:hypothetical protein